MLRFSKLDVTKEPHHVSHAIKVEASEEGRIDFSSSEDEGSTDGTSSTVAVSKEEDNQNAFLSALKHAFDHYLSRLRASSDPKPLKPDHVSGGSLSVTGDGRVARVDEDEKDHNNKATLSADVANQRFHHLSGDWAKLANDAIEDVVVLQRLSADVHMKQGILGRRTITYISKTWFMSQKKWDGFMTEMALFSHPAYLEPLQGIIIPRIIGVYLVDGGVSVAMELPSASFWVEASEDMSDELKLKCIKAFDALHDHSVLHGDVELHNILIGAEGNVTLVGFRKCRSTMPIEAVGLGRATDEDILLEKRLVKFKLNYGDAREREIRLMNRVVKRSESSKKRGPGHQGSWASRPTSRILSTRTRRSDKQVNEAPIEDTGHPVNAEAFASKWIEPEDFVPSCFIVPCLDEESVTKSVHQFMKMESERQESTPCIAEESRILSKSSVVASEYSSIGERPAASEFHLLSVEEHITDKKRRREGSDDDLISNSSPLKKGCHESTEEQPSDDIHVPYEGYAGPDGYTLPRCSIHDDDLAFLRRRWIQEDNARQCKEKHLDYPFELLQPGGVVTVGVAADGAKRKRMKNRGALRRLKYDAEHPNKRIIDALERLQVHRWQMHSNQFALNTTDAKQKAEGCDVGEAEGPRICSWFEFFIEENRRKVKTAAKKRTGPVGIMKSVSKRKAPRRGVLRRQLNAKECARLQGHDLKQPRAQDDADDWEDRQVSIRRYRELHASARAKNRTLSKFKASTSASGHSVGSCVGSIAKYAPSKQSINNLPELKSPTSSMPVDFRAHDAELAENKLESHQEESETERQAILPPEPLLQRGFMSLEEVMERLSEE